MSADHRHSCRVVEDDRYPVSSDRHPLHGREGSEADDDLEGDRVNDPCLYRASEVGKTPHPPLTTVPATGQWGSSVAGRTLKAIAIAIAPAAERGPVAASTRAHAFDRPRSILHRLFGRLEAHCFVLHVPAAMRYGIGIAGFNRSSRRRSVGTAASALPLVGHAVERDTAGLTNRRIVVLL